MAWLSANITMVLAVLLGVSESLALIPGVQANSIFQLIIGFLKAVVSPTTPKV